MVPILTNIAVCVHVCQFTPAGQFIKPEDENRTWHQSTTTIVIAATIQAIKK